MENRLVIVENNIPLADSREVASQLGIEHRSFFRLITEYQAEIEEDFGKVRLEITPSGKTNQPLKYALLTEDQTYTYMAYSQNTPQARDCKRILVKAFAEARQRLAQPQQELPPYQPSLEGFIRDTLPVPSREDIQALKRIVQAAEQYEKAVSSFLEPQEATKASVSNGSLLHLRAPQQKRTIEERIVARFHKPGYTTPTLREIARDTHTPTDTVRTILQIMLTAGQVEEFQDGRTCRYRLIQSGTVAGVAHVSLSQSGQKPATVTHSLPTVAGIPVIATV